jgi:NAD(P)-dependent dehydrogenase (short-subunit alcohol dehydrogenase family)
VKDFRDKLAVVTGGGTGIGRELVRQLSAAGCHVATCDVSVENMTETERLCREDATTGVRVSTHECDVSDEAQVNAFRDAVMETHDTEHVNLLFNNAGIGGGGSFIADEREEWERTFGVCWFGVYYCSRAFVPMLVASREGYIVNTSSVNGFWASLGPGVPHTAYSAAKFAVKGFSEALLNDLREYAPHVKVAVVMPGHIGTSIAINTSKVLGKPGPLEMSSKDVSVVRERLVRRGMAKGDESDDEIRSAMHEQTLAFRDNAPTTAAQAAAIILDSVREDRWRILVGKDAEALDELVRADPEGAYEPDFMNRLLTRGHFQVIVEPEE